MKKLVICCSQTALMVSATILFSSVAYASGFQLFEYGASSIGNFNAGGAAVADDATTTFANPAGLVGLPQEAVLSGVLVDSKARFEGQACGGVNQGPSPFCFLSTSEQDGGTTSVVPAFHYSRPLSEKVALGLGITAPFGLSTKYLDDDDPLRYTATKSEIRTININPSVGVRINDNWIFGFGIDALRIDAELDQIVNLNPGALNDTFAKNNAEDWGYGWNAGLIYAPSDNTRFGASFRSHIPLHLHGHSVFASESQPSLNPLTSHMHVDLDLPSTWMVSGFHSFNNHWDIMATAMYTGWDSLEQLRLYNAVVPSPTQQNPLGSATSTVVLNQNFDNTWRFSVGADYNVNDKWRVRLGAGLDKSPVNDANRTVRLPDEDRVALAAGVRYSPNQWMDIELSYLHLFIDDAEINTVGSIFESDGKVENDANLIGLQFTWNLDEAVAKHNKA
jgi:long-chain fatty acid transport protein